MYISASTHFLGTAARVCDVPTIAPHVRVSVAHQEAMILAYVNPFGTRGERTDLTVFANSSSVVQDGDIGVWPLVVRPVS